MVRATPSTVRLAGVEAGALDAFYGSLACGVVLHGSSGDVRYLNAAAERFLGVAVAELIGRVPLGSRWNLLRDDGEPLPEDELPAIVALREGRAVRGVLRVGAAGASRWVTIDAVPTTEGVLSTIVDATVRVETERQVRSLVRAEGARTLGGLRGDVGHDVGNALSLVIGHCDMALEALAADRLDTGLLVERLKTALQAATNTAETLDRVRREVPSGDTYPMVRLEAADLVREAAQLTAPKLRGSSEIRVVIEVEGETTILGRSPSLREALTNLVFNAVEAMPGGGTLLLAARRVGGRVIVEVSDSGIGMSADVQAQALEPFFTTKGEAGTGLGLSLVQETIRRHNGVLSLESAPRMGTTVRIDFPAAAPASRS